MSKAIGLIEVYGFATALYAIDVATKGADVTIDYLDKNVPLHPERSEAPLSILIKMRGDVAEVKEALELAKNAASEVNGYETVSMIACPDEQMESMLTLSCIK